jgi:IclR family mhp operon transcriptional activator
MRGLETLQELNRRNGASVTEIAKAVGLPRTTSYRVLETLCEMGLAFRDNSNDRYRLTLKVRSLADGFDDETWVDTLARPLLGKLAKDITWPLAIATLHGTSMLSRDVSTKDPLGTVGWENAGTRLPLLTSSAGRVFLAMCGEDQRATILDILSRSDRPEDQLARDKSLLNRIIAEVRSNGWAIYDEPAFTELNLAVTILTRGRFLASLAMRFTRTAMPLEQAVEKYIPLLKRAATEIGEAFENAPAA